MYNGTQRQIIGSITAKMQNLQRRFGPLAGVLFELHGRFSQSIFRFWIFMRFDFIIISSQMIYLMRIPNE